MTPKAREEELVVRELGDETLVYDLKSHKAHCLNRTAALVWKSCDGRRTIREIAAAVGREAGAQVDERVVWLGLERLNRVRLLARRH